MAGYVDVEIPEELLPQIVEMLSTAKDGGKLKKGINEATKSAERKTAQFVIIAGDVSPEEVIVHLPILCKEKGIPYAFVPTRKELGDSIDLGVGTSAIAVENPGPATEKLQDIIKKLPKMKREEKSK